jgi:hypothetical protein
MNIPLLLSLAILLSSIPSTSSAQTSIVSPIFNNIAEQFNRPAHTPQIEKFIIEEMRHWGETGIVITKEDIVATKKGDFRTLCTEKKDINGEKIDFALGAPVEEGSCLGLAHDLLLFLEREKNALDLGQDLLLLAGGDELAVSDEGGRPIDLPSTVDALQRIWSGTGSSLVASLDSVNEQLDELKSALTSDQKNINRIVMRYHFGYFRDKREADHRFEDDGEEVGEKLQAIADGLLPQITGDQSKKGDVAIKLFRDLGVVLWIRKDDLGLHFLYPLSFEYPELLPAGDYPVFSVDHPTVAYPFGYTDAPVTESLFTPLCHRTTAARGFLCRPLPTGEPLCQQPTDSKKLSLIECPLQPQATQKDACSTDADLRLDTGEPLFAGDDHSKLNPALQKVDLKTLCTPDTKVVYPDTILSHACYARECLTQSMSGHTLIPGRNPTLVDQAASPFLACSREDPRLGLSSEMPTKIFLRLPRYTGYELVRSFEQAYCGINGDAPNPLLGLCAPFNDDSSRVQADGMEYITKLSREFFEGIQNRSDLEALASAIGKQASMKESSEVTRTLFLSFASILHEISSLFEELVKAPLTTTPCPWTGSFESSSSSANGQ